MSDAQIPYYRRRQSSIEATALQKVEELLRTTYSDLKIEIQRFYDKYSVDGTIPPDRLRKYNRLLTIQERIETDIGNVIQRSKSSISTSVRSASKESFTMMAYGISRTLNTHLAWSFDMKQAIESIEEWEFSAFNRNSKVFAQLSTTARNQARNLLTSGLLQRKSYAEITKELKDFITSPKRGLTYQLSRVVRTEVGRAMEIGNQMAYTQAKTMGIDIKKRWLATIDNKTRDSHKALDGQLEDENGMFTSPSGAVAEHPHGFGIASEDINCRCSTIASLDDSQPQKRYVRGKAIQDYNSFSSSII